MYEFQERRIFIDDPEERFEIEKFLNYQGIKLDKSIEYTVGVFDSNKLVATGSFYKNTLRCLAVSSEYQGLGLMNLVASHLITEQNARGNTHIFVYTKGDTASFFEDLGFTEIVRVGDLIVFMENIPHAVDKFSEELKKTKVQGEKVAGVVINGNPFTLGHQFLVEKAASENDVVHVFVVSEESSVVPFKVRYELIKRGTAHLKNVVLHETGSYMVSSATFPSYFINDEKDIVEAHAGLDIEVFKKYIVSSLGITKRYVGDEPYDPVTRSYNEIMKASLEASGVECQIVHRREFGEKAISASRVRSLIREGKLQEIKELVPITTYEYLTSPEAVDLVEKIKRTQGRH